MAPATGTFPAPIDQNLSSTRYVASPLCIIPTTDPDLWGVTGGFEGRKFLGCMTTDEMLAHIRQDWLDNLERHNIAKTPAVKVSSLELDGILGNLDF